MRQAGSWLLWGWQCLPERVLLPAAGARCWTQGHLAHPPEDHWLLAPLESLQPGESPLFSAPADTDDVGFQKKFSPR